MNDSDIVYVARLHWIIFAWPVLMLCLALALGIYVVQLQIFALIFMVIALIWMISVGVNYCFSSLTIKKKQVILRTGILVRKTTDIPLGKIETIDIRQSVLGSILGYGALIVTGTGGTRHLIDFLDNPLTCRRYIEQLMHD